MRSVSMRPSATHESGHSYFAQTGHSHFAATQGANLLCRGQKKHTMYALLSKSAIPVEVSPGHFENAKLLQSLGDCSGGSTDFLPTRVCPERSASAVRGGQRSESNRRPRSTP